MISDPADKILVVEDEPALVDTLQYNLSRQGYLVCTARDGPSAIAVARAEKPNAIILDIMLPGMDGFDVCRILRRETTVPILMLTARDDEIDKVVGLEVGADDYLTKPFSMRELMARVKALLRRLRIVEQQMHEQIAAAPAPAPPSQRLIFDRLTIDLTRREITVGDETVPLKPKEYELLVFLAQNRGIALSRDTILEKVWGWDFGGGTRTVDVHVRWLREAIEADPAHPTRIITVRGTGYRFDG